MIAPEQAPPNPFGRVVLNGPADFVPEWDVPSFGAAPTTALLERIAAIDGSVRVDPDRRIQVLLGPPGYGKTHLFGRLAHRLGDRVLFVFVPPLEDLHRPMPHIRHHVVMSLFEQKGDGRSRLARLLAGLCRLSFTKYIGSLPRPLDARYAELLERLKAGDDAVFEIVDQVTAFPAFQRVGDSLKQLHPKLDGNVLHALALGWSPERDYACRWLRGEAIAEEHARRIGLPDDPPGELKVIEAVGTLTAGRAPVVLCIDQLDKLLADLESAPKQLSADLMDLRHRVPNLLVVLGCLKGEWTPIFDRFLKAFADRIQTLELERMTVDEAVELVRRRLACWPGAPVGRDSWWPISETSFRQLVSSDPLLRPRGVLKECERLYEGWAEHGDFARRIEFGSGSGDNELAEFRREWDKELAAAEGDKARALENVQDQRLANALKEGLSLRATGSDGVRPKAIREGGVLQAKGSSGPYRYSFEVVVNGQEGEKAIILAIEVIHSAQQFRYYFQSILDRLNAGAAGAVLVTPKDQVTAGASTRGEMEAEAKKDRLRVISLTDYRQDFARLECYLALLARASARDLQLAGATVDANRCRELAAEAGVLANLPLFDRILDGWVTPVPAASLQPPEPAAPTATAVAPPIVLANGAPFSAPNPPPPAPADDLLAEDRLEWAAEAQDLITTRLGEVGARVRSTGSVEIGPTFARFLVTPLPATTISKVRNRAEDLKVALGVEALPLVGSQAAAISIDVELPERFRRAVRLEAMGSGPPNAPPDSPAFPVGQDVGGRNHWLDLADPNACHLLVAGTTGSGKSEFLKAMIAALARRLGPARVAFALIDPKQVTFNFGDRAQPFLIRPVANAADEALVLVKHCFDEAERRFSELKKRKLEDLAQWQAVDPEAPPRLVLVCDEFADLMAERESKKELEAPLKRLGAKARAAGIHLVLATQRPEASVVTPLLRSNLPARICFRVASANDSKLILKDPDGADLLGRGDLIWQRGAGSVRLQSPYVSREDLEAALFPPVLAPVGV